MPYSGQTFTIVNSFTPDTKILSSAVNANFTDIATGLSNVVKLNGDSTLTGQLKAADGSAAAPGMTFGADLDTGLYRIGANRIGLAIAGADVPGSNLYTGVRLGLPPGFNSIRVAQAADTDHDVTFAAGRCRDSTDVEDLVLASAITKQIDAAWAEGTNLGGLDTGSVGNATIYYLWVIKNTTSGTVDALFSASATAPTMPSGYTLKQRVGWVRTNASANILGFTQDDTDINEIRYNTVIEDFDGAQGTSSVSYPLSLPPNSKALIRVFILASDAFAVIVVRPLTEVDASPMINAVPGVSLAAFGDTGIDGEAAGEFAVALDASSQLAARSPTTINLNIWTKGCIFHAPIVP